jgi:hypothetical protein
VNLLKNQVGLRKLHSQFAPLMVLPLFLTLITGSLFQIAEITDHTSEFYWLLDVHKGKFGRLNLEMIYPFLNSFGLLILAITGISMWWQIRHKKSKIKS